MVKSERLTRDQIEASWAGVRADIEAAIAFAENSPFPEPSALMQGVYSEVQS
jgi:TPP-dependent pyruvate/acetoin dehydrogenase alpha subunit